MASGGWKNLVNYLTCVGVGARDGTESVYGNNTSISGIILTITQAYSDNGGLLKGIHHPAIAENVNFTLSFEAKCTGERITIGYGKYVGGGTNQLTNKAVTPNTWVTVSESFSSQGGDIGLFVQPTTHGTTLDVRNLQLEIGSTATPYEPYSNICPISGWTGLDIFREASYDADATPTVSVTWQDEAGTVYDGTLNLTTGVLTSLYANIDSYNGESLPGKWISDRDVYSIGTTPTTGAQVVYELAAPLTYQLDPEELVLQEGTNVLWSDAGPLRVTFIGFNPLFTSDPLAIGITTLN